MKLYTQAALRVTVKIQLAELPELSFAVLVTVVVPTGKFEPDGGTVLTFVTAQLSVAVVAGKVTGAIGAPPSETVIFVGQVISGAVSSMTVTVKLQEFV